MRFTCTRDKHLPPPYYTLPTSLPTLRARHVFGMYGRPRFAQSKATRKRQAERAMAWRAWAFLSLPCRVQRGWKSSPHQPARASRSRFSVGLPPYPRTSTRRWKMKSGQSTASFNTGLSHRVADGGQQKPKAIPTMHCSETLSSKYRAVCRVRILCMYHTYMDEST